jgi:ribonuclease Z
MMRSKFSVKCFGTGDGWPCDDRNHAAFLYQLGGTSLLVDCGDGVDRSYKASGLSYNHFDAILLSHLHSDHFGGLFMLLQGCWLERRRKPLNVYLPKGAIRPLREMLNAAYLFDEVLPFRLELKPLVEKRPMHVGGTTVTSFRTSHLDGYRDEFRNRHRVDYNAYCFLLEAGGQRIGHSADLGKPEDLAPLLTKPLDLLVCELAHIAPAKLFRVLQKHSIGRVAFVHVARAYREELAKTRRLASKMLPHIPHGFAQDGDEVRF